MRGLKRILSWIAGSLAVGLLVGVLAVYALSEYRLRETYPAHSDASFKASRGDPTEGRRLAQVFGCTDCHSQNLTGKLMEDKPGVIKIVTPNLTLKIPDYTDGEFASALRAGVRNDGTGLFVMPTSKLQWMSDGELADMLAYLRTLPARGVNQPAIEFGPVGRIALAAGDIEAGPRSLMAIGKSGPVNIPGHEQSRRLAVATCGECHTTMLTGGGIFNTPDLNIAAAYQLEDFRLLLRTGKAAGGRELREMSQVSRTRYSGLTDEEIDGLHAYFVARSQSAPLQ